VTKRLVGCGPCVSFSAMRAPRLAAVIAICLVAAPAAWALRKRRPSRSGGAQYEARRRGKAPRRSRREARARESNGALEGREQRQDREGGARPSAQQLHRNRPGCDPEDEPCADLPRGARSAARSATRNCSHPEWTRSPNFSGPLQRPACERNDPLPVPQAPSCNSSTSFSAAIPSRHA